MSRPIPLLDEILQIVKVELQRPQQLWQLAVIVGALAGAWFATRWVRNRVGARVQAQTQQPAGRVDLLRQRRTGDPAADSLDLSPLLQRAGDGHARYVGEPVPHEGDRLGGIVHATGRAAPPLADLG